MGKLKTFLLISFLAFFPSCEKSINDIVTQSDNLLAEVGEKKIMVNDFIKRCEYVPRPTYCRGNNYIHKKIALNSLIAEKMFAIEFEKNNLILSESQKYLIQGQKEQGMRQLMLKKFGFDLVNIDFDEIKRLANLSKRTYSIKFITVDQNFSNLIKKRLENSNLEKIIKKLNLNIKISKKKITKNEDMIKEIHQILYSGEPIKNKIYGPFNFNNIETLYFEIEGWKTKVDVTEKQKKETWTIVEKDYREKFALKYYSEFVKKIMRGKKITYNVKSFEEFSNKLRKIYLIEKEKKEAVINNEIWEIKENTELLSFKDIKKNKDDILLTHDNKTYTIANLLDLVRKHPLVFRNKKTSEKLFSNELKYAIADLLRDFHITEKAYELRLEKNKTVTQIEQKWEDHIKSTNFKNQYFNSIKSNELLFNNTTMQVDSLQKVYSKVIKIDTDKFKKISLSTIDMNVNYSNQAYSKLEPSFPVLTNDHILDYGKKVTFGE